MASDPPKAKLLCSFGGKILPRPSDGALRYAGGHTRIISLRRSSTVTDLLAKIGQVTNGPVGAVKYQLPDEDLDALISISSQEDLDNMMEEFDRICEIAPDGSARMRIFLFSPTDLAESSELVDTGQSYIDAVNGIGLKRKDSLASGSSNEGMSPSIMSPHGSMNLDSVKLGFLGEENLVPSRIEPHQVQFFNPSVNVQPYVNPIYVNAVTAVPVESNFKPNHARIEAFPEEGLYRSNQISSNGVNNSSSNHHNKGFYHQPLSQLPPLHPTHIQQWNTVYVPPLRPYPQQTLRFEDCQLCQKGLPHAHSDMLINEHANGNGSGSRSVASAIHDSRSVLQSHHSEGPTRLQRPENRVETKLDTAAGTMGQFSRQHEIEKAVPPNLDTLDHSKVLNTSGPVGVAEMTRMQAPSSVVTEAVVANEPKVEMLPYGCQLGTSGLTEDLSHPLEKERVPCSNIEAVGPPVVLHAHNAVSGALANGMAEPKVDNIAASAQLGAYGFAQLGTSGLTQEICHPLKKERLPRPNIETVGPPKVLHPDNAVSGALANGMAEPKVDNMAASAQFGVHGFAPLATCGLTQEISHPLEKVRLPRPTVETVSSSKVSHPHSAVSGGFANSMAESKVDNMAASAQFGNHGFAQIPKKPQPHENERAVVNPNVPSVVVTAIQKIPQPHENERAVVNPDVSAVVGLPAITQASQPAVANPSPIQFPDPFHPLPQNAMPPHLVAKQDVLTKQNVSIARNENFHAAEPPSRVSVPEISYEHVRPMNGITESLLVSTFELSGITEQPRAAAAVNHGIPMSKPENSTLIPEINPAGRPHVGGNSVFFDNSYIITGMATKENSVRPMHQPPPAVALKAEHLRLPADNSQSFISQAGGNPVYLGNAFMASGIVPERNCVRPICQMPPSSLDFTNFQSLHSSDTSQVAAGIINHEPLFPYSQELRDQPEVPNGRLLVRPTYCCGTVPVYNNTNGVGVLPVGDRNDEASWLHSKDVVNNPASSQSGTIPIQYSNFDGSNGHAEHFQGPSPADSLFCHQDPRKVEGNVQVVPPRPSKASSKELTDPEDVCTENISVNSKGSEGAVFAVEGGLQEVHKPVKDFCVEPIQVIQGENIKQEVQGLAEQVVASVLQPTVPPEPVTFPSETMESAITCNKETRFGEANALIHNEKAADEHDFEGTMTKQTNMKNFGFPFTDEIGHLQIIKNSDLEELRELGSGTYGTVYHGKWRGSDVAIKRINERCFAGKPSEEERMRADFWNEACKLADMHHPNVVAFYGVVLDGPGGSYATVTEFMVNGSLRRALQKNDKSLDKRKRLQIAMDVAFGMEYLHGKNLIHFDIKSDNLLVNLRDPQRPICKVADLGLSKVKRQTLISGGVRGTLPWMAPELLNGGSALVSEKVDVFSFGIVMWELLTGDEPYADLHYGAIIGGIVSNNLRPPVPEACDHDWRSLMEQCWSADPPERPDFTEIASRLRFMAASPPQKA